MKRLLTLSVLAIIIVGCGTSHHFTKQKYTKLKKIKTVPEDSQAELEDFQKNDSQNESKEITYNTGVEVQQKLTEAADDMDTPVDTEFPSDETTADTPTSREMNKGLVQDDDVTIADKSIIENEDEKEFDERQRRAGWILFWSSFGLLFLTIVAFFTVEYLGLGSASFALAFQIIMGVAGFTLLFSIILLISARSLKIERTGQRTPYNKNKEERVLHDKLMRIGGILFIVGIPITLTAFLYNPFSGLGVLALIIGMILFLSGSAMNRKYRKANDPNFTKQDNAKYIALQIFGCLAALFASGVALFIWAYFGMGM